MVRRVHDHEAARAVVNEAGVVEERTPVMGGRGGTRLHMRSHTSLGEGESGSRCSASIARGTRCPSRTGRNCGDVPSRIHVSHVSIALLRELRREHATATPYSSCSKPSPSPQHARRSHLPECTR